MRAPEGAERGADARWRGRDGDRLVGVPNARSEPEREIALVREGERDAGIAPAMRDGGRTVESEERSDGGVGGEEVRAVVERGLPDPRATRSPVAVSTRETGVAGRASPLAVPAAVASTGCGMARGSPPGRQSGARTTSSRLAPSTTRSPSPVGSYASTSR
ncbi:hypothetical protein [Halarchaeum acidiphilum]|uniref:hypothetical protein n=1 Tax=Halarchaeum acidiphilum TaxID=489138 RepID=UPI0006779D08|nr:hypothetical protein [Halarchaeum acidiphilum]